MMHLKGMDEDKVLRLSPERRETYILQVIEMLRPPDKK